MCRKVDGWHRVIRHRVITAEPGMLTVYVAAEFEKLREQLIMRRLWLERLETTDMLTLAAVLEGCDAERIEGVKFAAKITNELPYSGSRLPTYDRGPCNLRIIVEDEAYHGHTCVAHEA